MTPNQVVFLLDVDNTLLDNDRIIVDLRRYLEREVGHARAQRDLYKPVHRPLGRSNRAAGLLGSTPGRGAVPSLRGELYPSGLSSPLVS